ncbi:MAG: hypothetical protein J6W09_11280 [Bacteroidales bacterium]|nr:hypothetical protein [Bacteroidales bacterium]
MKYIDADKLIAETEQLLAKAKNDEEKAFAQKDASAHLAAVTKTAVCVKIKKLISTLQQDQPFGGKQVIVITETDGDANIHWDCRSLDDVIVLLKSAESFITEKQIEKIAGPGSGPDYATTEGRYSHLFKHKQEQPEFPTTDEEVEKALASIPKVELPDKYKTPDWLFKQQEQPMPDSTKLIELWHEDKEMLKEKDFRDDPWRLAYNAFMCGFGRGIAVKKQEQQEVDFEDKFAKFLERKDAELGANSWSEEDLRELAMYFYFDRNNKDQQEVDLKKEIQSFWNANALEYRLGHVADINFLAYTARHFYELGLNARKED